MQYVIPFDGLAWATGAEDYSSQFSPDNSTVLGSATFSPCRLYRYSLWRCWGPASGRYVMFVGLNPSTADELLNDPTIRRCIAYARSWGYAGLCMANIFAFRATQPADMKACLDPIGPENDRYLLRLFQLAGVVVAAWGTDGAHLSRGEAVNALLPKLHCLKRTKDGHPGHPLYLRKSLTPVLMA